MPNRASPTTPSRAPKTARCLNPTRPTRQAYSVALPPEKLSSNCLSHHHSGWNQRPSCWLYDVVGPGHRSTSIPPQPREPQETGPQRAITQGHPRDDRWQSRTESDSTHQAPTREDGQRATHASPEQHPSRALRNMQQGHVASTGRIGFDLQGTPSLPCQPPRSNHHLSNSSPQAPLQALRSLLSNGILAPTRVRRQAFGLVCRPALLRLLPDI